MVLLNNQKPTQVVITTEAGFFVFYYNSLQGQEFKDSSEQSQRKSCFFQ